MAKIKWHKGGLFPKIGFIVTYSKLIEGKVVRVYNGRREVEKRIKKGVNKLRLGNTSCHRLAAKEARLPIGILAHNLLPLLRQFYLIGGEANSRQNG